MQNLLKISIVIPCYRSESTIITVIAEIDCVLQNLGYKYEIVLINDNSPDNVWAIIDNLCSNRKDIIGLNLAKNFGQHSALMAGYRQCSGDYIITMDDDGQTPSDEIKVLINKLEEGFDVVYGKYTERKDNVFRRFGSKVNNYMMEAIIGKPKDVHLTSFYISRKYIIDEICKYQNPYPYIWGLIVRTTHNIANVTINHHTREGGSSGYTLTKLLRLWMNGFTAFSVKPLRIATGFGLLVSIIGFFVTIYTVVDKLLHPDIQAGYSALMSAILIIGGVLMILLGMIGEYIGRIYICINNSPQYVIRDKRNVINREYGDNNE